MYVWWCGGACHGSRGESMLQNSTSEYSGVLQYDIDVTIFGSNMVQTWTTVQVLVVCLIWYCSTVVVYGLR